MRYKNVVIIIISIWILVTMGLGVAIIYSDYLYNPNGTLTSMQVTDMGGLEPGGGAQTALEREARLFQSIEEWAREEQATILLKSAFSAGCGFCGYSDWAKSVLGIEGYKDNKSGIYITDDPAVRAAYTSGDVFLPKSAALEIQGTYSGEGLPPVLENVDFLYPLSFSMSAGGNYFTDVKDVERLTAIFEEYGYSVVYVRQAGGLSPGQLFVRLLSDGFLSWTLLFAMSGLVFCFVYMVLLLYKDNARKLWIHHMFGLSRRWILLKILLAAAGTIMVSSLLFAVILANGLTYMGREDLYGIFVCVLLMNTILTLSVNGVGYLLLLWQFRLRGE